MKTFIQRFGKRILGVLHGFDRLRFRGTRRFLASATGMLRYLWRRQILLKDFKAFASNITAQVRQAAEEVAVRCCICPTVKWIRRLGLGNSPSVTASARA